MALNSADVFQYQQDWAQRLRDRLSEPSVWKEVCDVVYSDTRVFNLPYLADITLQSATRSSPYTAQAIVQSNETLTISTDRQAPFVIPEADYHQSRYSDFMRIAEQGADQIDAFVEQNAWATGNTTSFQDFDDGSIGGTAGTSITVSIANIDDIIAEVQGVFIGARGGRLLAQNGGFIIWQPGDWPEVQKWAMANGFQFADQVLRNGVPFGFNAGGLSHYVSTQLPSGRMVAGVKRTYKVGVLKGTYGNPKFLREDPGQIAGYGVTCYLSTGTLIPAQYTSLMLDIAVV